MTMTRSVITAALLIGALPGGLFPAGAAAALGFERQDASEAVGEAGDRLRASVHLTYNLVIFDGNTAREFVFSKAPDATGLNIPAPYNQDENRSILLKCRGFRDDGGLDDCQISAERELQSFGRQLAGCLAVDPSYLGSMTDSVEVVFVTAKITPADVGPCLPPECIPVSLTPRRNESAFVNYSTIFFQPGGWQQFEFSHVPDAAGLNIPFRPEKFAMIGLSCAGFTTDGRLEDCDVRVEPENAGYEDVGAELARELVVDQAFMRSLERPVKRISIHARVSNSDVEADEGPCWSPGCIPVPLPPPPPPQSD